MKRIGLLMLLSGLAGVALAKSWPQMRDEADKGLPPWIQYYDRLKGEPKLGPLDQHLDEPESLNVKLVGKWGRGPAARVTGRDTLVYLALGSEVAIFNCVNAHNPIIVNEIQCRYVVDRSILEDSILYCVLQGGVEVFDVANPASVTRIAYLPITEVDMCINDTMAYTIGADSFKAYRIVAPDSFQRLGACADSGYYIAADSGFAYLCDRWGLYVIDATDPTNPHQATIMSGGIQTGDVLIDSGLCYYFEVYPSGSFVIANVADPYHPNELSRTPSIGFADMYKIDFYLYLSTYQIVDVSSPASPTVISSLQLPANQNSVWTRSPYTYSFVADDYEGLATIKITDPVHPVLDTVLAGADEAWGVSSNSAISCVADYFAGMKVLDVGSPSSPMEVGSYDSAGYNPEAQAVAMRDTLAYLMADIWSPTGFRVLNLADPRNPSLLATAEVFNPGDAVALRDSLAYVAEEYHFEVFSIANPQNPRFVGSCQLPSASSDVCVVDTIAYVASLPTQVINVKDPADPVVVDSINDGAAYSVAVQDTIALVGGITKLDAVSVANPASPYVISSFPLPGEACTGIALDGSLAYVGTAANSSKFRVFDISDPESLRCIGYYTTPYEVRRVFRDGSLVYVACNSGGLCIFETTSTSGVAEASPIAPEPQPFELTPNPASSFVTIREEVNKNTTRSRLRFYDAAGRKVLDVPFTTARTNQVCSQQVNISALPEGCYFVRMEPSGQHRALRFIKATRRR